MNPLDARPSRWPRALTWALGLAAAGSALWALERTRALEEARAAARGELAEAARLRDGARAQSALAALRAQDALGALEASAGLESPLGRGVRLLAEEAGAPSRAWTVRTEAGCAALAATAEVVACATLGEVALFRPSDGASLGALATGPRGWQQGVAVLSDGRLASGGDDRTLRRFEAATRRQVGQAVLDDGLTALAAIPGGDVLVGLRGGQVLDGKGALVQRHHLPVTALVTAPGLVASSSALETLVTREGHTATLASRAGALAVWGGELVLGVERAVVRLDREGRSRAVGAHLADVTALAVLESGRLVSGDAVGQLRWWDEAQGLEGVASVTSLPVQALWPWPEGVLVAAGRTLEAWRLPARVRPTWPDRPTAVVVSSLRAQVLAGFQDGRVQRLGDPGRPPETLEVRLPGAVRAVAEVPGEEHSGALRLLAAGDDGQVRAQRWSGEVEVVGQPGGRVAALAVSPDGRRAAWASADGQVVLFSLEFRKEIGRQTAAPTLALAFSPDGRRLAAGREDRRLWVLDAETAAEVAVSEAFDAPLTRLAWPSPPAVVVGRADGAVLQYQLAERRVARQWTGPTRRITALAVQAGRVAAGSADGQVWVWGMFGAAPVARLPADASEVRGVGFQGAALVFGGADRRVHRVPTP